MVTQSLSKTSRWQLIFALAVVSLVSPGAEKAKPQLVTVKVLPAVVVQGQKGEAGVEVQVAPGYHVQANPASQPYLIATTLYVEGGGGVRAAQPIYPPGKPYRLAGSKEDILTFDGKFQIRVPLQADTTAKPGERKLSGKIRFQACDDRICHSPETTSLTFPLIVKASK